MKIILKNSSLVFQKRVPKNNYNWSDISSDVNFMQMRCLAKDSGNVATNSAFSVSGAIMIEGATSILVNGTNNNGLAKIGFFNSALSITEAVYYLNGDTSKSSNNEFTIDSAAINAAIDAGADCFRVSFLRTSDTGSITITRPTT